MRRFFVLSALVAMLAMPALAGQGKAMGCCGKQSGVQRSVANVDNGVRITMTATDPKVVASLQEMSASCGAAGGCADCPMHGEGVTRTVEKTADGIVVTATATDPAMVAKLQQHAATMGAAGCAGAKAEAKAGCCAKGAAGMAGGCPRAAAAKPATT
jgi:hypothetical protein